jgi:hypothetical protein
VANALEAQPGGGSVHVACRLQCGEVRFDVCDGDRASARAAAASPTPFTTRAEGTGLGLALVHTIAKLHGGRSRPSAPAPRQHGGSSPHQIEVRRTMSFNASWSWTTTPQPRVPRGSISQLGYHPIAAKSGNEALGRPSRSRPTLVLTDLRMPGTIWPELVKSLK